MRFVPGSKRFHAGTSPATGLVRDCQQGGQTGCLLIPWPGWRTTATHAWGDTIAPDIDVWYGGLVDGMRDASGQMYMRNRYYDPATGQFTQTDPIGIAGGLNAYGFAAGDPVSFSDPYGLCPDSVRTATDRCPGDISVQEWNAVEAEMPNVSAQAATRTRTMLDEGRVRGDNLEPDVFGEVRPSEPDVMYINRTFNSTVSDGTTFAGSIFGHPIELGKTVVHEGLHTFQLEGISPGAAAAEFMRIHGAAMEFQARMYHIKHYRVPASP